MPHLGEIMTHLRLVLRMGQATGTDIVAAHEQGHLTQQDWAEMVHKCRGCDWANRCPDWLDRHEIVKNAPQTCRNRQRFAALQTRSRQEV
ncbi:DUF6455 family protein [Ruegeria profundi]|uniref:DUF6455 family protein n=1 Tax=Ruegeria profundi TaxID=1685378 RepID=UPI001CD3676C|nr:DUF6455 family protein [Ruegeria profundi]MCA0929110.1 DUF6455 family protein [Ruegeria profundi]